MAKKIMDLIPESLHQQLKDEVVADLKAQGWYVEQAPKQGTKKDMDADIAAWAKANSEFSKVNSPNQ